MVSNKYRRDFTASGALKRPGRFDPIVLQDILNAGDGHPGLQRVIKNLMCSFYGRYIMEGCTYDGTTLTSGFIMWDADVVDVSEQAQGLANGEFLYLDGDGIAQVTAVEATALAGIIVSYRTGGGVLEHIATKFEDNELDVYSFVVNHNLTVEGDADLNGDADLAGSLDVHMDLDVGGITNLDVTDIDDTLDVSGIVDFHSTLDMNNNDIQKIKDLDVDGIADIEGAVDINSTLDIHGDLDVHNSNIDDVASIDGGGNAIQFDDDISLPSNNITLGAAQTVDGVNISAIALNNMPAAATGNIDCNAQAITNVGNVDGVDVSAHAADNNAHHAQSHALDSHTVPAGNIAMNSKKFTGLVNGSVAADSMAFGQKTVSSEINLNDLNEKSYDNLNNKPTLGFGTPTDTLVHSNDDERSAGSSTFVKVKEIKIYKNLDSPRVFWEQKGGDLGHPHIGILYINGVDAGYAGFETESALTWESHYVNMVNGLKSGDLLQIYVRDTDGSSTTHIRYMRIKFDEFINNDP